jgi:hypothetical protein
MTSAHALSEHRFATNLSHVLERYFEPGLVLSVLASGVEARGFAHQSVCLSGNTTRQKTTSQSPAKYHTLESCHIAATPNASPLLINGLPLLSQPKTAKSPPVVHLFLSFTLRERQCKLEHRDIFVHNFGMFTRRERQNFLNKRPMIRDPDRRDEELAQAALDALYASAGVRGHLKPLQEFPGTGTYRPDVAIEINIENKSLAFYGECKSVADRSALLARAKAQLDDLDKPGLLISPHLSAQMADRCRAIGLNFIDTAGNAFLSAPGTYIFVKGQKAPDTTDKGGGRTTASSTALRIMFALLTKPELLRASYREIVDVAGVALGAVGWVFKNLEKRGLITSPDEQHGRQLLEPGRMLDDWTANYPIKLRPKLNARRFHAPDPQWWQSINPVELNAWWGGEIAADQMTGMLKPSTQTLYITPHAIKSTVETLVKQYRLRPDPQGSIELLDAFWNVPRSESQPGLAPPALVYADLVASLDSRNLEIAKTIREKVIANT